MYACIAKGSEYPLWMDQWPQHKQSCINAFCSQNGSKHVPRNWGRCQNLKGGCLLGYGKWDCGRAESHCRQDRRGKGSELSQVVMVLREMNLCMQ